MRLASASAKRSLSPRSLRNTAIRDATSPGVGILTPPGAPTARSRALRVPPRAAPSCACGPPSASRSRVSGSHPSTRFRPLGGGRGPSEAFGRPRSPPRASLRTLQRLPSVQSVEHRLSVRLGRRDLSHRALQAQRRVVRVLRGDVILQPLGHQRVARSEEHTSELQSHVNLVCRLLLEKKKEKKKRKPV